MQYLLTSSFHNKVSVRVVVIPSFFLNTLVPGGFLYVSTIFFLQLYRKKKKQKKLYDVRIQVEVHKTGIQHPTNRRHTNTNKHTTAYNT